MALTTWDGHARVAYLPDTRLLRVTLATIERTVEADVRRGLRAGFVVDGPEGPPATISAELRMGSVPVDLADLLGPALGRVAESVVSGPERVRWVRLDLAELDDLAAAWAPYRMLVLAPQPRPVRPTLGVLASRLWARLDVEDLRAALAGPAGAQPAFRGADRDPTDPQSAAPAVTGTWTLPVELAEAAGVVATLRWTAHNGRVTVTADRVGTPTPEPLPLWASFDDGAGRWRPLLPSGPDELSTTLVSAADPDRLPAVRVRTGEDPTQ